MATVSVSSENELIEELRRDYADAPIKVSGKRPIIRISGLMRPIPNAVAIRRYYFVATMKDPRGDILRLERYCGDVWDIEEQDKLTYDKLDKLRKNIEEACEKLFIEVRGGVIEEE